MPPVTKNCGLFLSSFCGGWLAKTARGGARAAGTRRDCHCWSRHAASVQMARQRRRRAALLAAGLAIGAADREVTYSVYESRCQVPAWRFLQQGCLGGTMQSWSYGDFLVSANAPAGLASGGEYAMALKPDWSTALWLHGSLIFTFGDLVEISFQVYNSDYKPAKVRLVLCGGDGQTQVGGDVETADLPSRRWLSITYPFSRFAQGGNPISASQQINAMKVVVPPLSGTTEWVYVTEMKIVGKVQTVDSATATADWQSTGRVVSPMLFGVNMAKEPGGYTSNRWGGNAVTRYAWDLDVQNRARDWFYQLVESGLRPV